MLTKAGYISLMQHAIGGGEPASGHDLSDTLNRAGRAVFGRYSWQWLMAGPVNLVAVEGSYDIDLPANFGEAISLQDPNNITTRFIWTTPDQIMERRRLPQITGLHYYVSVNGWTPQATPGAAPVRKLMMDKAASSGGNPTFQLVYRRQWVDLVDDDAIPDMPSKMEESLIRMSRAMAWSLENDGEHPDMQRALSEMEDQKKQFARGQPYLGFVRGGAGERLGYRGNPRFPYPPGFISH